MAGRSRPSGPKNLAPDMQTKQVQAQKPLVRKDLARNHQVQNRLGQKISLKQPEANRSDQTLSIRKNRKSGRPQRPGKPKQGGFKPVRRKSSR